MKKLLIKIILFSLAIFFAGMFIKGISVDNATAAILAAVAVIFANSIIKPIVKVICLPINLATLGLFSIIINIGLMFSVVYFIPGLNSTGIVSTLIMSVALSVLSVILNLFL